MSSAFAPDGSEPLGRILTKVKLRTQMESIPQFYQLDKVTQFLVGYEGNKLSSHLSSN